MTEHRERRETHPAPFPEPPCPAPGEPPVYECLNRDGQRPLLIVCDHASNRVPAAMNNLGLADETFEHHIAYDIGAADVARELSRRLDAPAVLGGYSRLVVDLNRQPGDPQAIPVMSDGIHVPGNDGLDEPDEMTRIEAFHEPYHHAVSQTLAHIWHRGGAPWLFSLHSFTPRLLGGKDREWDIGVMWNRDPRLAMPMIEMLRREGLHVGENEPYSGKDTAYTINRHAGGAGLPHVAVEIRQDHLKKTDGAQRWAQRLERVFRELMEMDSLHGIRHF